MHVAQMQPELISHYAAISDSETVYQKIRDKFHKHENEISKLAVTQAVHLIEDDICV